MKVKIGLLQATLILFSALMLSTNLLVKLAIKLDSLPYTFRNKQYPIMACSGIIRSKSRFVTKEKQELYQDINTVLTPVYLIPFVLLASYVIRSKNIFDTGRKT